MEKRFSKKIFLLLSLFLLSYGVMGCKKNASGGGGGGSMDGGGCSGGSCGGGDNSPAGTEAGMESPPAPQETQAPQVPDGSHRTPGTDSNQGTDDAAPFVPDATPSPTPEALDPRTHFLLQFPTVFVGTSIRMNPVDPDKVDITFTDPAQTCTLPIAEARIAFERGVSIAALRSKCPPPTRQDEGGTEEVSNH